MNYDFLMNRVEREYNIQVSMLNSVKSIYKEAAVLKLETSAGTKALKEFHETEKKLRFVTAAMHHLQKSGADVLKPFRTRDKSLYFKWNNRLFYLTDWYEGRPFDALIDQELQQVTRSIAAMHRLSKGIRYSPMPTKRNIVFRDIQMIQEQHRIFTRRIRELRQRRMTPGRELLLSNAQFFLNQGRRALSEIRKIEDLLIDNITDKEGRLVHDDLTCPNLLVGEKGVRIIDFDRCRYGLRAIDFASYLSNTLGWTISKGKKSWQTYMSVYPMSRAERKLTINAMLLPREAWEIARLCLKPTNAVKTDLEQVMKSILNTQNAKEDFIASLTREA